MFLKKIRRREKICALFLMILLVLISVLVLKQVILPAVFFGASAIALFVFLMGQRRFLLDAALIWDNRIISVPSAIIYTPEKGEGREIEETIVSTFGLLIGDKIYKWGSEGLSGVRLITIEIDRVRLALTFGEADRSMRVELLHGIDHREKALEVKERLWRETGITAGIDGWEKEPEKE